MEKKTLVYKEALKLLAKDIKREYSNNSYMSDLVFMLDNHVDIVKVYVRRAERKLNERAEKKLNK